MTVPAGALIATLVSTGWAGAAACTLTAAVPATLVPPAVAVAVMVAAPTASAVTSPDAETDAMAGAADVHATEALMALPDWSRGVAVSCDVCPTVSDVVPATVTDVSTGGATTAMATLDDTVAAPDVAVAVTVAVPAPTAETRPEPDTVATPAAEELQFTVAAMALPDWSRVDAESCTVCPGANEAGVPAGTAMDTEVSTGVGADGSCGPVVPEASLPPPLHAASPRTRPPRQPRRATPGTNLMLRHDVSRRPGSRPAASPHRVMVRTSRILQVMLLALGPAAAVAQKPYPLARPETEFGEPFTAISGIRELKDGRIIVADARDKTLQLIDLRSGVTSKIGREGSGPGEYALPMRLIALPGDSSAVFDAANQRYLTIHPDGRAGRDFRLEAATAPPAAGGGGRAEGPGRGMMMMFSPPRGVDARGNIYYEGPSISFTPEGGPQPADSAPVMRFDRGVRRIDTVAFVRLAKGNANVSGGRGNMSIRIGGANPLVPRDDWVVLPDGRVAVVRSPEYRVDFFSSLTRRTTGPTVAYDKIRVDDAVKKMIEDQRARNSRNAVRMSVSMGSGGAQRSTEIGGRGGDLPPLTDWPGVMPPFLAGTSFPASGAIARPNGEVWVQRTQKPGIDTPLYDVFDASGRVIGHVVLPAKTRLLGFGQGTVYLVRTDDDDLQYLQRYRLPTDVKLVG